MRVTFFDPAVGRYVLERLTRECKVRRGSAEISKATGISQSHISNVLDGTRNLGPEFAVAMCKYWGLKQDEVVRKAHKAYATTLLRKRPERADSHPELADTIDFCCETYPAAFLREFEARARTMPDKPRMQWLVDLHAQFYGWLGTQEPADQSRYLLLASAPLPGLPAAPAAPRRPSKKAAGNSSEPAHTRPRHREPA